MSIKSYRNYRRFMNENIGVCVLFLLDSFVIACYYKTANHDGLCRGESGESVQTLLLLFTTTTKYTRVVVLLTNGSANHLVKRSSV